MTGQAVTALLLLFAAGVCLLSCLGIAVMHGFYDKLHYLAPAAILGTGAVTVAVVIREGISFPAGKALIVLFVMVIGNPAVTHAAARAKRVRDASRGAERRE